MSKPSVSAPAIEIHRSEPAPLRHPLVGRHLDRPKAGAVDGDLLIVGWALSEHGPLDRALVLAGDHVIATVRADRHRHDISSAFADIDHATQSGFRIKVPAVVARGLDELVIAVAGDDEQPIPVWTLSMSEPAAVPPPAGRGRRGRGLRRGQRSADSAELPAPPAPPVRATARPERPTVVALISAYNEADMIGPVLDHLAANDVQSYLIDNGSTDDTVEIANRWLGRGLLGIESVAAGGDGSVRWQALLNRKLELAGELGADWYMHHDADEIRESPWPGVTLREAIAYVDRLGYNAIDFRVLNFPPVDDNFSAGEDPCTHFTRWEEPAEYDRMQRKCWKAGARDVSLEDGGHDVQFSDRTLFPTRFLLRHYPVRGQTHGTRKVLRERKNRFAREELALGWHRQYDDVTDAGYVFLRNPATLHEFDLDRVRFETGIEDARAVAADRSAPKPTPDGVRGFLELLTPRTISGWAIDGRHDEPPTVQLWDGPRLVAAVRADGARPDLLAEGIGGGHGGFSCRTPRELLDGRPHWIWATVEGTTVALRRSPLVLHTSGGSRREVDAAHRGSEAA